MAEYEPYRDPKKPGRFDIDGVEWWACDPYPCWFRWENGELFEKGFDDYIDGPEWAAEDPEIELERAKLALEAARAVMDKALGRIARAQARVEEAEQCVLT